MMGKMEVADFFRSSDCSHSVTDTLEMRTESGDSVTERSSITNAKKSVGDIMWSNISYSMGPNQVLLDCWGHVQSGQVCAVLGPSGAGKSTLLNVLAGRCATSKGTTLSGTVKVGSKKINPVKYRKHIAYVMQDDCLMATATPREALLFSAMLRLPSDESHEEITALVDKLLSDLGLMECADVMIGSALIKGISGGQRKRTSVGVELIADPAILFLDEPTTGLDSFCATNLIKLLKSVASTSSAVLCTIHQPSSEVFALFDIVIFMHAGRIFYQGPVSGINTYYADLGQKCPENYSPSDFVMNLCQSLSGDELERMYMPANTYPLSIADGFHAPVCWEEVEVVMSDKSTHFVASSTFAQQMAHLTHRELVGICRDPSPLLARYGIAVTLSVLFGLVFLGVGSKDNGDVSAFNAHVGLAANCMFSTMLGNSQALLLVFPLERPVFLREYSTGTYSTTAYMLSKLCLEIPLTLLEVMIMFMFAKLMSDLQGDYFQLITIAFGLAMTSNSLAMIQGAIFPGVKEASAATAMMFLPQIFYSGFFTRIDQIPQFIRWPQYLCALSYATKLMFLVEFNAGLESCRTSPAAQQNCHDIIASNGQEPGLFWVNAVCLFALFVCARVIAGLVLTHKARTFA